MNVVEKILYGPVSPEDLEDAEELLGCLEDCFFNMDAPDRENAVNYTAAFIRELKRTGTKTMVTDRAP